MTTNLSTLGRNGASTSVFDLIDVGSIAATGRIEFRTGVKPTNTQAAATGIILATCNFSNPAFGPVFNGQRKANTITTDTNTTAGKIGWFRIYNRDSVAVLDGDVTTLGGGGDIELSSVTCTDSGILALTALSGTQPQ